MHNKANGNLSFKEVVENLCKKEMERFMKVHFWTKEGSAIDFMKYSPKYISKYLRTQLSLDQTQDLLLYWNYHFQRKQKIQTDNNLEIPNSKQVFENDAFFREALEINFSDLK